MTHTPRIPALLAALGLLGGCYGGPIGFVDDPDADTEDGDDNLWDGDDDDAAGDDDDSTGNPIEGDQDGDGIRDELILSGGGLLSCAQSGDGAWTFGLWLGLFGFLRSIRRRRTRDSA